MGIKLKTDNAGDLVAFRLTGFEIRTANDLGVFLAVEYIETLKQLETGERSTFQTFMTSDAALDLAETLTRAGLFCQAPNSGTQIQ